MHAHNLIVGGDLNFSLGLAKTRSPIAQVDPLVDLFLNKLREVILIEKKLIKIIPTWRNAHVAKRLGKFLFN